MRAGLSRFWRLPTCDRLLLLEAGLALCLASLLIMLLPFRRVVRTAGWFSRSNPVGASGREALHRRLRWAVPAVARRLPWSALCFQQGLAVQWMLRRRGVPAVLHYGAANDTTRGLIAHVWVCDANTVVIGGPVGAHFALLARFPDPGARP